MLPEPAGALAGELSGEIIDAAEALDGDKEGFVFAETSRAKLGHLAAQVVFEFVDIDALNGLPPQEVDAPLADLRFDGGVHGRLHGSHASAAFRAPGGNWDAFQALRSASETASHWRRCSPRARRPAWVTR